MGILVKICGINSAEAADAAARAGADMAGLVFHPRSPRNLRPEQASALADRLRGKLRLAVLLSDPSDEAMAAAVAAVKPDFVQLHGAETPERVAAIRDRFASASSRRSPWRTHPISRWLPEYEDAADMLLFDAKAPTGADAKADMARLSTGRCFRGRNFARPWLLAGGLNPDNVVRAIRSSEAPGVDVSSGVETSPGQKSGELISQFVANARSAQFAKEARS